MRLYFLAFVFLGSMQTFADGNGCATTIKCQMGTATCSASTTINHPSEGECGLVSGKALVCRDAILTNTNKEYASYICCKKNGTAYVTRDRAQAGTECDNTGTIQ